MNRTLKDKTQTWIKGLGFVFLTYITNKVLPTKQSIIISCIFQLGAGANLLTFCIDFGSILTYNLN